MLQPPWTRPVPPAENRRLFRRIAPDQAGIDALLHDVARPKHQHASRRDGHFLTGLGIAADPLALLADAEGAEGGELDGLARCQAARNLAQDPLDQFLRLIARQSDFLDHRLCEICTRQRFATHGIPPLPSTLPIPDANGRIFWGQQQPAEIAHLNRTLWT